MFCGKCGAENQDGANFCTQCGVSLTDNPDAQMPQQYQQPGQPSMYNQPPSQLQRPDMKETFKHSAVSGAGTYAGCCCMNAISNMLCDACE